MRVLRLPSVDSTNRYCEALDLASVGDFTCYWALEQTDGIGQRGNHWESAPCENLTFSLVLHPSFLPAAHQFKLTEALSLAVADCLAKHLDGTTPLVKWPNDIYVGGGKICGMLVSNRLAADAITTAICGIGLNVNQRRFPQGVPHPTSLALLTGRDTALEPLLHELLGCIHQRYSQLQAGTDLEGEYLGRLMNLGRPARYRYHDAEIEATITGLDPHGRLLLSAADGRKLCCGMKEIALLG